MMALRLNPVAAKTTLTLITSILMSFAVFTQENETFPDEVRKQFFAMNRDSCAALKLSESLETQNDSSALMLAYAGALEAASAECVQGGFRKLEYFSRGKKKIEEAISRDAENPEIRFLRFATQAMIPGFLEYDNLRGDKKFLISQLPALIREKPDEWLWKEIIQFMLSSGKLTKKEKEELSRLI